jgi:transposase-like protein
MTEATLLAFNLPAVHRKRCPVPTFRVDCAVHMMPAHEHASFDHSVDHSDDTKAAPAGWQRIEVITGVERQRKWSAEEKAEIVAESLAEGAVVSEVARRHGLSPQQLFGWRARLRDAVKGQGDRQMQRRHSCQPSWRTSRRPRLRRLASSGAALGAACVDPAPIEIVNRRGALTPVESAP